MKREDKTRQDGSDNGDDDEDVDDGNDDDDGTDDYDDDGVDDDDNDDDNIFPSFFRFMLLMSTTIAQYFQMCHFLNIRFLHCKFPR